VLEENVKRKFGQKRGELTDGWTKLQDKIA